MNKHTIECLLSEIEDGFKAFFIILFIVGVSFGVLLSLIIWMLANENFN